jgi:hypothetical protein
MVDKTDDNSIDLDYVILAAVLAGGLTAVATVATLLARPVLVELGKQLPLPTIQDIFPPEEEE